MSMKRLVLWFTSRLYWISISYLYKTARVRTLGEENLLEFWGRGKKVIVCFFHGNYLFLFPHFRGRDACIFTTRSRRGETLSEIIRLFGYQPCLIPDQRGKKLALDHMIGEIKKGRNTVMAVDGPLGPYRKVKHGIVILAKSTGNPIFPIGIASSARITLKRRWDRYTIPLPFTRSVICVGAPIHVPGDLDEAGVESFRQKVEQDLLNLNRKAEENLIGPLWE